MTILSARRVRRSVLPLFLTVGVLAPASRASAEVETFQRFEENATASWVVTEDCGDGSTSTIRYTVIAGREFESPDLDDVNTFATVLIRGFTCEGDLVNDRGSGPATYTGSPSLQDAQVTGTIPLRSGSEATLDVTWQGTGRIETTTNSTHFPGFTGLFTSKRREAVATGTIAVDGVTAVSGAADSAEIETLEDRNLTLPAGG